MEKTYKILKLLSLVLIFAVVILGASTLYDNLSGRMEIGLATAPAETEAQAVPAPDFTVYDVDGNAYKLSDFKGKPVILNFWASWCSPCKMEMPDLEKAWQEYGEQIQFMLVDLTDGSQETVEKASAFIKAHGYTFPVFYDTAMEGAYAYGVSGIPVTYFINAEGVCEAYFQGAMTAEVLQQGIDMLM